MSVTTPGRTAAILRCVCVSMALCVLAACGKTGTPVPEQPSAPAASAADAFVGVTLSPDEIRTLGVATVPASTLQHVPETLGFGVVVPHESIAQTLAEISSAAAAERQSRAALTRSQRLAGTPGAMPADAQDSAERQAAVDDAALLLARERLSATFGQSPPWKNDVQSPLLRSLADGTVKLVRVTFPLGSVGETPPAQLQLAQVNAAVSSQGWSSSVIWNAPADAAVPGRSFYALLKTGDAGEGERLLAWAPTGQAQLGVLVPETAAIISNGKYWCYIEREAGRFVRIELDTSVPVSGGYFVTKGVRENDSIVTAASGLLLAHESNPGPAAD